MSRVLGLAVFAFVAIAGLTVDRISRKGTGSSFTQTLRWLNTRPAGRLLLFAAWGFTGWHFFVR